MEDENLKLDKLVVQATCWDCKRPLHSVKGDVTVFLQGKLIMSVVSLDQRFRLDVHSDNVNSSRLIQALK